MSLVLWFTGLSGSGKTTIAEALKKELGAQGKTVEILDGDTIREKLHRTLGFSREDIRTNNRLIAELAKQSKADVVLVPVISPYREDRAMARQIIGKDFREIFVNCPLGECIRKDVKGLYQKALRGEIKNFIGIATSNPYEPPERPDLEVRTDVLDIAHSVDLILSRLPRWSLL